MHPGILGVHFGSNVFLLIVLVNINAMYCHVLFLHHFQTNFNTSGFGKTFDNFILAFGSIYIYIRLFFHNLSFVLPDVVHLLKLRFNLGDKAASRGHRSPSQSHGRFLPRSPRPKMARRPTHWGGVSARVEK